MHASNKSQLMKGNHVANWQEENPSCRDLRRTVTKVGLPRYRRGSTRFQSRQNCAAGCPYPQSLNWSFHSIQPSYLGMTNSHVAIEAMALIEIVDFPVKTWYFPAIRPTMAWGCRRGWWMSIAPLTICVPHLSHSLPAART